MQPHGQCPGEKGARALEAALAHIQHLCDNNSTSSLDTVQLEQSDTSPATRASQHTGDEEVEGKDEAAECVALVHALQHLAQDWCGCSLEACIAYAQADSLSSWLAIHTPKEEETKRTNDKGTEGSVTHSQTPATHQANEALEKEKGAEEEDTTSAVSYSVDALAATHTPPPPKTEPKDNSSPPQHSDAHDEVGNRVSSDVQPPSEAAPHNEEEHCEEGQYANEDEQQKAPVHSSTSCSITNELPNTATADSPTVTSTSAEPSHGSCVSLKDEQASTNAVPVSKDTTSAESEPAAHSSHTSVRSNDMNEPGENTESAVVAVTVRSGEGEDEDSESAALGVDMHGCIPYTYYAVHASQKQGLQTAKSGLTRRVHTRHAVYSSSSSEAKQSSYFASSTTPKTTWHALRNNIDNARVHLEEDKELRLLKKTHVWSKQALAQYRALPPH